MVSNEIPHRFMVMIKYKCFRIMHGACQGLKTCYEVL